MINTHTHKPIRVSTEDITLPHIIVPLIQLDQVLALLKAHGVPHWADHQAISIDGRPAVVFINLRSGTDPQAVQQLLDRAG